MTDLRPFPLCSTFVVLQPGFGAVPVEVTPDLYERLDRDFEGFRGRLLAAVYAFTGDWPTWEIHPAGDELLFLVSGEAELVLAREGREECVRLSEPGTAFVIPKNTWHTARIPASATILFLTPGEGTRNEVAPEP